MISTDWPCKREARHSLACRRSWPSFKDRGPRRRGRDRQPRGSPARRTLPPRRPRLPCSRRGPDASAKPTVPGVFRAGSSTSRMSPADGSFSSGRRRRDEVQFLERNLEPSWDQARAARPLRTRYRLPAPADNEDRAIHELARHASSPTPTTPAGASFAHVCGTPSRAPSRLGDSTTSTPSSARALADGRPVDEVHVYFHLEATARAERRPLLDGGVRVYFLGPGAELVEVVD